MTAHKCTEQKDASQIQVQILDIFAILVSIWFMFECILSIVDVGTFGSASCETDFFLTVMILK